MRESVTVVGGCGQVGLPLGIALANAGTRVTLLDANPLRVESVLAGRAMSAENDAEDALADAIASGRLAATTDGAAIPTANVVLLAFDPELGESPDFEEILSRMRPGQLLILRSTLSPGDTDRLADQIARQNLGIELAYCPDRIRRGNAFRELPQVPQLVAGSSPRAFRRASDTLGVLGMPIVEVSTREAELAQLFENMYRSIQSAVGNQFFLLAESLGVDFHRIRDAIGNANPAMASFPQPAFLGGPRQAEDALRLAGVGSGGFPLGEAAMTAHDELPAALVDRVASGRDLRFDTVAILGMAPRATHSANRETLGYRLRRLLQGTCREVLCTDPYLLDPSFVSLGAAIRRADVILVGEGHDAYRGLRLTQPVVDPFRVVVPLKSATTLPTLRNAA